MTTHVPVRSSAGSDSAPRDPIQLLLADERTVIRRALASFLKAEGRFGVSGEADSVDEVVSLARNGSANVLLLAMSFSAEEGWTVLRRLKAEPWDVSVIALAPREDPYYAERALRCGAKGYVLEQEPEEELFQAIRSVARGQVYVSERVRWSLLSRIGSGAVGRAEPAAVLTDRQLQVFRLLGEGKATREVARRLEVSPKTVETHRTNIMRALGLQGAHELLYRAIQWVHFR